MKRLRTLQIDTAAILLFLGLILGIASYFVSQARQEKLREAQVLKDRMTLPDTLQVVTLSGATTYFTIQGEEMGYQFELLKLYSESVGIPYQLKVLPSLDCIHSYLESGRAQLSITPEAVTSNNQKKWLFTGPKTEHSLVLVQRSRQGSNDSTHLSNVAELIGKPLYILSGSYHQERLKHLGEQLGAKLDIRILPEDTVNSEDLIALVATDSIDYTIVDSEIARLSKRYYPNIDSSIEVGFPQRLRWLTTSRYLGLAQSLEAWFAKAPSLSEARYIYKKYFDAYKAPLEEDKLPEGSKFRSYLRRGGSISAYDSLFKQAAKALPWKWQLLAAIAYQESRFNASIVGWSGARGLMGIMPSTGRIYGATREELLDADVSVRVAVRCLLDTEKVFKGISDANDRLKFTLAAYNAGVGHIQDAQRLARKYGYNPKIWEEEVEHFVLLKSERKYYSDPVCRHGYLRGKETKRYAEEVFNRYKIYRGE